MEQYDYRNHFQAIDRLEEMVECFSNQQLLELKEDVERIKQAGALEARKEGMAWFDMALLPILKRFAETTASLLEIQRNNIGIITAEIRSSVSIDIIESGHYMHMAMITANAISINNVNGENILGLIYDCDKFISCD